MSIVHALFRHEELEKKYKCDQCDFATHIPGHLRRHLLVHSGSKPFSCPHCDYSCNNIENLRKHVISTAKHKGKFLYECKFCPSVAANEASSTPPYGTNFQKEFKDHLQHSHKLTPEEVKIMYGSNGKNVSRQSSGSCVLFLYTVANLRRAFRSRMV
uniref:C2H2-type domain-containing protein n=1 Tax=Anopheles melas TaxID=34690 RepID=A0A182TQ31_9DIPT